MPSHVYHEVDVAYVGGAYFWASWGASGGRKLSAKTLVELFVKEFTFASRYSAKELLPEDEVAPCPVLAVFVSSGDSDHDLQVYAYEVEHPGAYNVPKGRNDPAATSGWTAGFRYRGLASENIALRAMAWALLTEATRRREEDAIQSVER